MPPYIYKCEGRAMRKTNKKALCALLLSFGMAISNLTVFATEPDDDTSGGQTVLPEGEQTENNGGSDIQDDNKENTVVLQNEPNETVKHYAEDITADKHDYEILVNEEVVLAYTLIGENTSDESIKWELSGESYQAKRQSELKLTIHSKNIWV